MRNERGNVLFLILIGIGLFAALSFAVSNLAGSSASLTQDQQTFDLRLVLNHFAAVRTATQDLVLTGRCDEDELRFWHADRTNALDSDHYGDGSNTDCQIFDPAGGGVTYLTRPAGLNTAQPDEIFVISYRVDGVGESSATAVDSTGQGVATDLIMGLNVPLQTCLDVNQSVGVTNPGDAPPSFDMDAASFTSPSTGGRTFPSSSTGGHADDGGLIGGAPADAPELSNQSTGCFQVTTPSVFYVMYSVILPR